MRVEYGRRPEDSIAIIFGSAGRVGYSLTKVEVADASLLISALGDTI